MVVHHYAFKVVKEKIVGRRYDVEKVKETENAGMRDADV
jgi:hypothetical protein